MNRNLFITRILSLLLFFNAFIYIKVCGQEDSLRQNSTKHRTRNIIWFIPSKTDKVNGIAIGPLESGLFFDKVQKINGLTIVFIGSGILMPLIPYDPFDQAFNDNRIDSIVFSALDALNKNDTRTSTINGLMVGTTGAMAGTMNGLTISFFCGGAQKLNGVSIHPLMNLNHTINGVAIGAYNSAGKVRGVQIGIINKAVNLKGIQIGIWNKSRKRSLPFFNWG